MSWNNFNHLTRPLVLEEAKVKGPGKHVRGAAIGTDKLTPHRLESQAGASSAAPHTEILAFVKRQAVAVRPFRAEENVRTRPWFNVAMTQSHEDLNTFLAKTVEQLRRGINAQSLAEAQAVFNEFSRTPQGAAAVRRHVNPETLSEAIKLSKGRK